MYVFPLAPVEYKNIGWVGNIAGWQKRKEKRNHEYSDVNIGSVVIWLPKKGQKGRKRQGKYDEYIDGNIEWVVIWVTKRRAKNERKRRKTQLIH